MENSDIMIEKKKENIYNVIIGLSILVYIFIYLFFVYKNALKYSESITASFMLITFSLSLWFYGYRIKTNKKYVKSFIGIIAVFTILYFVLIYGIGFATSFLKNSYSLKPLAIFNNTFFLIVIIIAEELLRFVFIKANKKDKIALFIFTFILILLDIIINLRFDTITDNYILFETVSTIIIPIIIKNIMCSYAVYYADYKGPILYRLLTELYIYIVPIQPDLNDYINSIGLLLLPFLIIINMSRLTDEKSSVSVDRKYKLMRTMDIPFIIAGLIIYCLICGYGPYKMIGIQTGSMTPKLNIGDAVIITKTFNVDNLKEGDIIAYKNSDNDTIVHRIIKVNSDDTFITKGDYNNIADREYVKKEQIKGKVVFKIPYIAYPAIMFK